LSESLSLQYSNGNGNHEKHNEKLTSAQRAQIVWHILLRIGSGNQQNVNVMSLEQLLETDIISAAYPIHDGSIKLEKGEDVNNINDRRVRRHYSTLLKYFLTQNCKYLLLK